MKWNGLNSKEGMIVLAVLITVVFVFFSVPSFLSKEKLENLAYRLESYKEVQSGNELGSTTNPNKKPSSPVKDPSSNQGSESSGNKEESSGGTSSLTPSKDSDDSSNEEEPKEDPMDSEMPIESNPDEMDSPIEDPIPEDPEIEEPIEPQEPKTFTAHFLGNGSSFANIDLSCKTKNDSCDIILPSIHTNRKSIGWSTNSNDTIAPYLERQTISLHEDMTFYAITRQDVTVSIEGNGAYNGTKNVSCSYYNTKENCTVTLPRIEDRDFYTIFGYATNPEMETILYQENQTLTISDGFKLYAVRSLDTSSFVKYSSVAQEVYQKINQVRKSVGVSSLSWSKSLELSAMLRASEVAQNYDFEINGDHHYRISNLQPFYSVNAMAKGENYYAEYYQCDAEFFHDGFVHSEGHYNNMIHSTYTKVGIGIGYFGDSCYIVELFG